MRPTPIRSGRSLFPEYAQPRGTRAESAGKLTPHALPRPEGLPTPTPALDHLVDVTRPGSAPARVGGLSREDAMALIVELKEARDRLERLRELLRRLVEEG